jgi:hypothetical protein
VESDNSWRRRIKVRWNPHPVKEPQVDPDLPKLSGLARAAEALRYAVLRTEHWLCPGGKLREWARLNGKLSALLAIPALLVLPLITFVLWQIATWVGLLFGIVGRLIVLPLAALLAAGVILFSVIVVRALLRR